jgi:hypothetical protein
MMHTPITIVSGLPRSGTSMMMKMLQAGGFELLVDGIRSADEDNPRGYFEYEKVKRLHQDSSWIHEARGKVLKVVSPQLPHLPAGYQYRVVFMERRLEEIIQSQNAMLHRRGQQAAADDGKTRALFVRHLAQVGSWLAAQKNFLTCRISFNSMLAAPEEEVQRLFDFLGRGDRNSMVQVIDRSLYRKKHGEPAPPETATCGVGITD